MSFNLVKKNHESFEAESLFLAYYDRVFEWALHLTGHDHPQAEDLIHDVFIQLTLNPPDIKRIENWENYLFIVLRNFHRYRLRQELRRLPHNQISITDYDSLEAGLQTVDDFEHRLQIWEDLQTACEYSCQRKETSRAGSVFILRFFHGYYPTEIARIFCGKRSAVSELLRISRAEVRAVLENSSQISDLKADQTLRPFSTLTLSEYSTEAILKKLRERVFAARTGNCLSKEAFEEIYQAKFVTLLDRARLAHIVSCPECLNQINKILNLSDLNDRFPPDMLKPDGTHRANNSVLPFPKKTKTKNQQKFISLEKLQRRLMSIHEHEPRELWVMANEMILGKQPISQAVNEQTLGLEKIEEVRFISIFSEQNIQLFGVAVEPPPIGDFEQKNHLKLSDNRSLTVKLSFCGNWQNVHVIYADNALESTFSDNRAEVFQINPESAENQAVESERKSFWNRFWRSLSNLPKFLRNRTFWLNPITITILIALPLIIFLLVWRMNLPEQITPITAQIIEKATNAEKNLALNSGQILRRQIQLEERRVSNGEIISRRNLEIWKRPETTEKNEFTKVTRILDAGGKVIAGEWEKPDGVRLRKVLPTSKTRGEANENEFSEAVWLEPSINNLMNLAKNDSSKIKVVETENAYLLETDSQNNGSQFRKISLTVNKNDYRAINQTVWLETEGELRELRFAETKYESRPLTEIPSNLFNPALFFVELPVSVVRKEESQSTETAEVQNEELKTETTIPEIKPTENVATAEMEVEALNLLNLAKADLNEQISVVRVANGKLKISGIVETAGRKEEIIRSLSPMQSNPAVEIKIQTVSEAIAERDQQKRKNSSENSEIVIEQKDSDSAELAAEEDLHSFFKSRGMTEEKIKTEIRNFAQTAFNRSRRISQHAGTLHQAINRFSPTEIESLTPQARNSWRELTKKHARNLQTETANLRQMLAPVFGSSEQGKETFNKNDLVAVQRVTANLVRLVSETDRQIRAAFSVSANSNAAQVLKTNKFRSTLQRIEQIASELANN